MPDTIGRRIAQRRKMQSLSQEALGERLGVSRQAISKWEADASIPEVDRLIDMSKLFGVSVDWLLSGEGPAPEEPLDLSDTITQALQPPEQEPAPDPDPAPAPAPVPPPQKKHRSWPMIGCAILTAAGVLLSVYAVTRPLPEATPAITCDHTDLLERIDSLESDRKDLQIRIGGLSQELAQLQDKVGPTYSNEDPLGKTTHPSIIDWSIKASPKEGTDQIHLRLTFLPKVSIESAFFGIIDDSSTSSTSCSADEEDTLSADINVDVKDGYRYFLLLKYSDGTQERIILEGHGLSDLKTLSNPTVRTAEPSLVVGQSTMDRFWAGYRKVDLFAPGYLSQDAQVEWSDFTIVCYNQGERVLEKDLDSLSGLPHNVRDLTFSIDSDRYDCGTFAEGHIIQLYLEGTITIDGTPSSFSLPLSTWQVHGQNFIDHL